MRAALQWSRLPLAALAALLLLLPLCVPSVALPATARPSYPAHASMHTRSHAQIPAQHSGGPLANQRGGGPLRSHSGSPSSVRGASPPIQECWNWIPATTRSHGSGPAVDDAEVAEALARSIATGNGLGSDAITAGALRQRSRITARSRRGQAVSRPAQQYSQASVATVAPPPPPSLRSAHYNATEQSLLDFWQRSGGPDWSYPTQQPVVRWNTANTSLCSWRGVVCDPVTSTADDPVVTEIHLRQMSLQNFVPDMFSALVNLTRIDLSDNCLYSTDGFDLDMSPFSQLVNLDFSGQWNLVANLPDSFFATLTKLQFLDLGSDCRRALACGGGPCNDASRFFCSDSALVGLHVCTPLNVSDTPLSALTVSAAPPACLSSLRFAPQSNLHHLLLASISASHIADLPQSARQRAARRHSGRSGADEAAADAQRRQCAAARHTHVRFQRVQSAHQPCAQRHIPVRSTGTTRLARTDNPGGPPDGAVGSAAAAPSAATAQRRPVAHQDHGIRPFI